MSSPVAPVSFTRKQIEMVAKQTAGTVTYRTVKGATTAEIPATPDVQFLTAAFLLAALLDGDALTTVSEDHIPTVVDTGSMPFALASIEDYIYFDGDCGGYGFDSLPIRDPQ